MNFLTVQEIFKGEEAGVPISTNLFSPEVKVLLVERVEIPAVEEAFRLFILLVPSPN